MSIAATFSQAVRKINDASARATPHVLPERHMFTQYLFPFISQFFDVTDPKLGPGQQKFKTPGSIKSVPTHQIQPKIYDFGTMATNFATTGTAVQATADTNATIAMAAVTGLRPYDLLRNRRSGAVIQVRSVSSLTVTYRGAFGGTVGGGLDAINAGDTYDFVGNAYPDGATLQNGNTTEPVERSNYLQPHVTETDMGWFAEKRKLFPDSMNGNDTDELANAIRHNEGRERALLFGVGGLVTIAGELIHAMNGLETISTLEYDAGGTITMDEWRTTIAPLVFVGGGGGMRKGLAGNTVLSAFDSLLDGKVVFNSPRDKYSIRMKELEAPAGTVELMGCQPMQEREGQILFYDPDLITRLYLEGFDTVLFEGMAPNNVLKTTNALITVETILVHNPDSVYNVTNILA
jgi:hypothetical protein